MLFRHIIGTMLLLALFAVVGTGLVALTHAGTQERIAANEREALLKSIHALIPPSSHDNDIFTDTVAVIDPLLGNDEPHTAYRARSGAQAVAVVLTPIAPDGYNGTIKLLVAINHDSTLAGVRILSHRETPGLGDGIEVERSDWVLGFNSRSLSDPAIKQWGVKKDGGAFDQFTGATITPRAVVNAVKQSLLYFRDHRDTLFALPQQETTDNG
ncbi:hypothetical protein BOW53_15910 [Solemya pervernicosa gill symbiont]|uniref:Ion-translocating oxidoreductase complex subunit G n=2 Tax=Gammaproteobacteria incertae sedis TaxID=118884 RepID=A0A1T2KZZ6_9GAMM|nr:electron transport complex subunit RsxG [Candidatus Reidiella endopervernicosa]OOZ38330.1 hypothetical protein BOW53_15910 [Solemya pervernicosa gill symbiont]QKQ27592.1 electron transport complex subunit RsxG [Candidatus Reidiella endopervernicosa]